MEIERNGVAFSTIGWVHDHSCELDRQFPSYLTTWVDGYLAMSSEDTHFGYVDKGTATLVHQDRNHFLHQGMFFCAPGYCEIFTGKGRGVIISREAYYGMFLLGGPLEHEGRLRYIDGCTDSLLVPPVKLGDPCLNLLYFPEAINQTAHIHPSDRIGLILSGKGECVIDDDRVIALKEGMLFCVHTNGKHKFRTKDHDMRVLAYHPDSDFGPTDQFHPMKSRTIIEGIPASDNRRAEYWT